MQAGSISYLLFNNLIVHASWDWFLLIFLTMLILLRKYFSTKTAQNTLFICNRLATHGHKISPLNQILLYISKKIKYFHVICLKILISFYFQNGSQLRGEILCISISCYMSVHCTIQSFSCSFCRNVIPEHFNFEKVFDSIYCLFPHPVIRNFVYMENTSIFWLLV